MQVFLNISTRLVWAGWTTVTCTVFLLPLGALALISASRRGSMDRRGSNLGGGGGSILPVGRSTACAPSAADVDALARAHRRVWRGPSERRLYGRSNRCLRPAEVVRIVVDDDDGPRWSPWGWRGRRRRRWRRRSVHGESGWWDVRGVVTALRLGAVQLCRVSCACDRRYFEATFASAEPGPGEPPILAYPLGLLEEYFNARAGLYRRMLWASKQAGLYSPEPIW
jgi:hypothetical protein